MLMKLDSDSTPATPDLGMIAHRQAHGAEQKPDRDLAGKVVDELERPLFDDALERAIGDLQRRFGEPVEISLEKSGLAQRAQPIMPRRIGRSQRRAGAPGKLVNHVAGGGGERLPVARRLHDVVVTRQDPELRAVAPVAGIFFAKRRVIGKRVGIDQRRIKVERLHGISSGSRR